MNNVKVTEKDPVIAFFLQLFLAPFGVGYFYLNKKIGGLISIFLSILFFSQNLEISSMDLTFLGLTFFFTAVHVVYLTNKINEKKLFFAKKKLMKKEEQLNESIKKKLFNDILLINFIKKFDLENKIIDKEFGDDYDYEEHENYYNFDNENFDNLIKLFNKKYDMSKLDSKSIIIDVLIEKKQYLKFKKIITIFEKKTKGLSAKKKIIEVIIKNKELIENEGFGLLTVIEVIFYPNIIFNKKEIESLISEVKLDLFEHELINSEKRTIIKDIDEMNPFQFESWVSKLFEKNGYSTRMTSKTGDFGADILASKDGIKYVIEVKHYNNPVGNSAVQQIIAAKEYYGCDSSIVVTNATFTLAAKKQAKASKVKLIDRKELKKELEK
jgi:HJR/Mrr/RecB family endonuclease